MRSRPRAASESLTGALSRFAAETAIHDIHNVRVRITGAGEIVVGHDFTYGRERKGNADTLRVALEERGVRLHLVAPITVNGLVVSSTKIREFTLEGRLLRYTRRPPCSPTDSISAPSRVLPWRRRS